MIFIDSNDNILKELNLTLSLSNALYIAINGADFASFKGFEPSLPPLVAEAGEDGIQGEDGGPGGSLSVTAPAIIAGGYMDLTGGDGARGGSGGSVLSYEANSCVPTRGPNGSFNGGNGASGGDGGNGGQVQFSCDTFQWISGSIVVSGGWGGWGGYGGSSSAGQCSGVPSGTLLKGGDGGDTGSLQLDAALCVTGFPLVLSACPGAGGFGRGGGSTLGCSYSDNSYQLAPGIPGAPGDGGDTGAAPTPIACGSITLVIESECRYVIPGQGASSGRSSLELCGFNVPSTSSYFSQSGEDLWNGAPSVECNPFERDGENITCSDCTGCEFITETAIYPNNMILIDGHPQAGNISFGTFKVIFNIKELTQKTCTLKPTLFNGSPVKGYQFYLDTRDLNSPIGDIILAGNEGETNYIIDEARKFNAQDKWVLVKAYSSEYEQYENKPFTEIPVKTERVYGKFRKKVKFGVYYLCNQEQKFQIVSELDWFITVVPLDQPVWIPGNNSFKTIFEIEPLKPVDVYLDNISIERPNQTPLILKNTYNFPYPGSIDNIIEDIDYYWDGQNIYNDARNSINNSGSFNIKWIINYNNESVYGSTMDENNSGIYSAGTIVSVDYDVVTVIVDDTIISLNPHPSAPNQTPSKPPMGTRDDGVLMHDYYADVHFPKDAIHIETIENQQIGNTQGWKGVLKFMVIDQRGSALPGTKIKEHPEVICPGASSQCAIQGFEFQRDGQANYLGLFIDEYGVPAALVTSQNHKSQTATNYYTLSFGDYIGPDTTKYTVKIINYNPPSKLKLNPIDLDCCNSNE